MSDIFREVDEDIRKAQLRKLWDRFAPYIIGAAVLIVVGTAGYRGWEYWQNRQAEASGDRFAAAIALADDGKHDESIAALQELVANGSGSYPVLARFRIAAELARSGDTAGAVAEFDAIAAGNAPEEVRSLARLRAALLLADTATLADLESRLNDLAGTGNPWRHTARDILALAAWRVGDYATAKRYLDMIAIDQEAPQDLRQRVLIMAALVDGKLAGDEPAAAAGAETSPQQ